jgi:hypothetical protein
METAQVVRIYAEVLAWPLVTVLGIVMYRDVLRSMLPGAKVKLTISGVTFETSIPEIELSVAESLRGRKLTSEQWSFLRKVWGAGRTAFVQGQLDMLRPLRDSGLIRGQPEGFLQNANEVEITPLGRLLIEASVRGPARAGNLTSGP